MDALRVAEPLRVRGHPSRLRSRHQDIDLLVDASAENIQRLNRAMAVLLDKAVALIADDEVETYPVVRIADEIVVGLLMCRRKTEASLS